MLELTLIHKIQDLSKKGGFYILMYIYKNCIKIFTNKKELCIIEAELSYGGKIMTKANREKWKSLSNEYEFLSWQIEALNKRLFEVLDAMDKLIEEDTND